MMEEELVENEFYGGFLYTTKEMKMHVDGPKGYCSLHHLNNMQIGNQLDYEEMVKFVKDGFFQTIDVVPSHLLRKAREYINEQYDRWMKISRRQDDWRIHLMVDLTELETTAVEHVPVLDLLLQSPALLVKLEAIMGSKPCGIFYNQVAYRTPLVNPKPSVMEYSPGAEYHIDGQANGYGTRFPDPWSVLVGVALVDIDSLNMGNFTIFPGTHRSVNWSNYPSEKRSKTLPSLGEPYRVSLKAGCAVFAHVLLPHRGGKNIMTADRMEVNSIDYLGLPKIPKATREMVFFRVKASHMNYLDPLRNSKLINNPLSEHVHLLDRIVEVAKQCNNNEVPEEIEELLKTSLS